MSSYTKGYDVILYQGYDVILYQGYDVILYQGYDVILYQGYDVILYQGYDVILYQGYDVILYQGVWCHLVPGVWHQDVFLTSVFYVIFTKRFNVNFTDMSQTEHYLTENWDMLAYNLLNKLKSNGQRNFWKVL